MNFLRNLHFTWWLRRLMEWGGIFGTLAGAFFGFYNALPLGSRAAVDSLVATGEWQAITLGSLWPIALALWAYVWSYRSTTATQIVSHGQQTIPAKEDKPVVAATAQRIERKPGLLERLAERFQR